MAVPGSPRTRFGRRHFAQHLYADALESRYKPNNKSIEVIGLVSGALTHITTDSVPGTLTQTIFDTTSRADSAQILLTNSTGASKVIIAAWIRGKPVIRLSDAKPTRTGGYQYSGKKGKGGGGGFLHDKYVDYERIAQDGDITFETGNNFVVTADQVNKLADYYWKLNRTKKHIYTLSLVGFCSWFEPGEWYTLQIGGAGQEEYIDSTVECFDVRCSIAAGAAPYTSVSFREVEENWKFDSNEVARQIAAGDFSRRTNQNVVTVAAQYYSGYADYYCDGANDQEEINSAISHLSEYNGGVCHLTPGDYTIASSISLYDNVVLEGEGAKTRLVKNCAADGILASGSASVMVTNCQVRDMAIYGATDDTNVYSLIKFNYVDGGSISNVVVSEPHYIGILLNENKNCNVYANKVQKSRTACATAGSGGIYFLSQTSSIGNNICTNNFVDGYSASGLCIGIVSISEFAGVDSSVTISNNKIRSVTGYTSSMAYGIYIDGEKALVSTNYIANTKNLATTSMCVGLYISSEAVNVCAINNYCANNGADTGIANSNEQNFHDEGTDTQWAG